MTRKICILPIHFEQAYPCERSVHENDAIPTLAQYLAVILVDHMVYSRFYVCISCHHYDKERIANGLDIEL